MVVELYLILILSIGEGEESASQLVILPLGTHFFTHWIGSWVDPRAGMDICGEGRKFHVPAGFQTLAPSVHILVIVLGYPGSNTSFLQDLRYLSVHH